MGLLCQGLGEIITSVGKEAKSLCQHRLTDGEKKPDGVAIGPNNIT
ncbi:hypothetical protein [Klebsiella michiganensis]|nr:hypothetical protein [Klebsiella michiganensis]MDH0489269.1 hypothetical protein [Klebsiella michiganensis]MDS6631669.1 hypothetical protein [Klebsiella michiganensis]